MEIMLFTQNLPVKTSELWQNIENTIGENKILLLENTEALDKTNAKPLALKCRICGEGAIILYRNRIKDIDPCQFTHELLHIHRYLVQGIPMLMPKNTEYLPITSDIETTLEHLTIVPEEVQYGYNPYSDRDYMTKFNWENFNGENFNCFSIKKICLLGWLSTKNLTRDPQVITLAEKKLKEIEVKFKLKFEEIDKLNFEITNAEEKLKNIGVLQEEIKVKTKEEQLRIVLTYLNIPLNEVELEIYDYVSKKTIRYKFPS